MMMRTMIRELGKALFHVALAMLTIMFALYIAQLCVGCTTYVF